jgi:rhodanese-related sulfurtransferase
VFDVPTVAMADLDAHAAHAVLLDVREHDEWEAGHASGAVHVPMSELPSGLAESGALDGDRRIVVVCRVGARSAQVAAWLDRQGYDAVNLAGGMIAWAHAGRPIIRDDGQAGRIL